MDKLQKLENVVVGKSKQIYEKHGKHVSDLQLYMTKKTSLSLTRNVLKDKQDNVINFNSGYYLWEIVIDERQEDGEVGYKYSVEVDDKLEEKLKANGIKRTG